MKSSSGVGQMSVLGSQVQHWQGMCVVMVVLVSNASDQTTQGWL